MLVDLYSESINSRDSSDSSIVRHGPSLTLYQVTELLNTSVYDYEIGTRCGWHEHREIKFCSLATVNIYRCVCVCVCVGGCVHVYVCVCTIWLRSK